MSGSDSGGAVSKSDSFAASSESVNSSPSTPTPPSGGVFRGISNAGNYKPAKLSLVRQASSAENLLLPSTPDGSKAGHGHYVPRWVQRYIAGLSDRDELDNYKVELDAAVMCVDIVGFTALTGLLSTSSSAEGAEHVSQVLNAYFGRVLEVIESFDGDVIQFSGDALMIIFNHQNDIDSNSLVCIKCAQAICHTVEAATVNLLGQQIDISLKLGVASGPVTLMISGGYKGRWISLAGGDAWNSTTFACDDCPPSHIVVHTSASRHLRRKGVMDGSNCGGKTTLPSKSVLLMPPFAAVTKIPSRQPATELSEDAKLMLRSFLPRGVLKQQRNELRSVVTIFVKFCDINGPTAANTENLYSISTHVQKSCHKFGAFLNKVMFDDKGLLALICFGVPQYVHADDTERGCLLSAELVRQLQSITKVVIGITRSRVYCGELGNVYRGEYTVLGDSVNLACRLMSYASGLDEGSCIVADDTVHQETKDVFLFKAVNSINVKGKSEEITAAILDLKALNANLSQENILSPRSSASSRFSKNSPMSLRSRASGDSGTSSMKLSRRLRTVGSTNEMWNYTATHNTSPEVRAAAPPRDRRASLVRLRTSRHSIRTNTASLPRDDHPNGRTKTIVGRELETDQFLGFVSDFHLQTGKNKVNSTTPAAAYFIIEGIKGSGKSAYIRNCAQDIPQESVLVTMVEGMQKYQYSTVTQLLKVLMGMHEDGSSPIGAAWLREVVGEHEMFEPLTGVVERILPGVFPKTASVGKKSVVSGDLVRELLEICFTEHSHSNGGQVVCLMVDDFQYMDPYSMGVLMDLMDSMAGKEVSLCMALTVASCDGDVASKGSSVHSADSDEAAGVVSKIKSKPHLHIELEGLSRDAAIEHYKQFLQASTIDMSLADVVYQHSEGLPFMAELVLNSLVDQDYLACNAEGEATLLKHDIDLSDFMAGLTGIESEILKRLDTLVLKMGDSVSSFMKTVCVMGVNLDTRVLRGIFRSERSIGSVHSMCSELVKRKIFTRRDQSGVINYTFRSAMFPKVQYNNMLISERKEAHMKVACAMEELQEEISIDSTTVATHFYNAELYEEALMWFTQALEVALDSDNFQLIRTLLNHCINTATQLSKGGTMITTVTPATDPIVPLPGTVAAADKYSASEGTMQVPTAVNGMQIHLWKQLLVDTEVTLGNLKHSKRLVSDWCGVAPDVIPSLALDEEKKVSKLFGWCCKPQYTPIADGSAIGEYMTGLDLAVLSNDGNLFLVLSGSLMRDKMASCKDPTLLMMSHAVASLRELILGRRKEAEAQWAKVKKVPHMVTLPMLMCFASFGTGFVEDTFKADGQRVQGYSSAASSRVNLMGLLLRVMSGHLEGNAASVVGVLDTALHTSRKVRNRPLFLKCVLMGRVLKLTYELSDTAPRSVTNSDDLLYMVKEDEWNHSADDTVMCMAYAVCAAEPIMGSPLKRRKPSRTDLDRDPVTLIQAALKHLNASKRASLHPILVPCIILLVDVVMWSVKDGNLQSQQGISFLNQLRAPAECITAIFHEWGTAARVIILTAIASLDSSQPVHKTIMREAVRTTEKWPLLHHRLLQWGEGDESKAATYGKGYKMSIPTQNALRSSLNAGLHE
eukprot:TRINITY_DN3540_c2_g1_i1.p1 TRINITY_DN3540_c2_g1~~TRINITY_DN3540_c2_g1_i1.p1  ORF type:complete len:1607 (+),score=428.94 TRINITY_DN3540_c2_g1_i1:77-4897(+)